MFHAMPALCGVTRAASVLERVAQDVKHDADQEKSE
jgi:hypothetical protein